MNERRSRNLDTVLAAAAAPPLPEEEDAQALATVLTMFNTAGAAAEAGVAQTEPITALSPIESGTLPGDRPRPSNRRFQLLVKCAVVFGLFLGASIAIASTGILPSPVQSFVHHMFGGIGVPGPSPKGSPGGGNISASATPSTGVSASPDSVASASASGLNGAGAPTTGAPGAGGSAASPSAAEASLYSLCTQVMGSGNSWTTTMSAADQARLVTAAGSKNKVHSYCAHLLKSGAGATPSSGTSGSTDTPSPTPSPTKTKGKGAGSGNNAVRSATPAVSPSPEATSAP